jgi:hypothetical protein
MSNEIDVFGIDLGELVAALHNGTKSVGMGRMQDLGRDMTAEEARREYGGYERGMNLTFDYYHGRPVKVRIDTTSSKLYHASLYDRDAPDGDGSCQKAVDLARSRSPQTAVIESVDQKQITE